MEKRFYTALCPDYEREKVFSAVDRIIDFWGGPEAFMKKGRKVLIKPNLLMAREPDTATTAHPLVVEAVARRFVEAGAEVTIADSPGGPYNELRMNRVYKMCGMDEAARASGARLNRDWSHVKISYPGFKERNFSIITPVAEADVVISIGKMKTHLLTYFTGAVKNCFGTVAGLEKAVLHSAFPGKEEFSRMIVDLCQCVSPALSLIDGVLGMDGKGPSGGRVRNAGIILGSVNPFACDLAAMHYCGLSPELSPIHRAGVSLRLVPEKYEGLLPEGDSLVPLAEPFVPAAREARSYSFLNYVPGFISRPIRRALVPYPKMGDRCIGCGECARACPRGAITVENGKASVDKTKCIQCYCCHELCPVKAVTIK